MKLLLHLLLADDLIVMTDSVRSAGNQLLQRQRQLDGVLKFCSVS